MKEIKGTTFDMGCPDEDKDECCDDNWPAKSVRLNAFLISQYEITNEQFCDFLNDNMHQRDSFAFWIDEVCWKQISNEVRLEGGKYAVGDNMNTYPVACVSWYGAKAFCRWVNKKYAVSPGYRLPTEAEWEYAAKYDPKRKKVTLYSGSDDEDELVFYANVHNKEQGLIGKDSKRPNGFELYNMSGNVQEWCNDAHSMDSTRKVLKGGAWDTKKQKKKKAFYQVAGQKIQKETE
jgi:formylglycine-generating enzyme required for sulfatase activity